MLTPDSFLLKIVFHISSTQVSLLLETDWYGAYLESHEKTYVDLFDFWEAIEKEATGGQQRLWVYQFKVFCLKCQDQYCRSHLKCQGQWLPKVLQFFTMILST